MKLNEQVSCRYKAHFSVLFLVATCAALELHGLVGRNATTTILSRR